jgi:hypothetical protein
VKKKNILYLRRGKRVNYPRKEYKKSGDFLLFKPSATNKGEGRKFSIFLTKNLRENQGI